MLLTDIPGATPLPVCHELRLLAARVPGDQAIVEIGVYQGRSVCHMGQGAMEGVGGAHVWGIDPWDLPGERKTYEQTIRGLPATDGYTNPRIREAALDHVRATGLSEWVTLIRGFAADVASTWDGPPIGLLYVDGDHLADVIASDFFAWKPHLARNAIVAFDDHAPPFEDVISTVGGLVGAGKISSPIVLHERLAVTRLL